MKFRRAAVAVLAAASSLAISACAADNASSAGTGDGLSREAQKAVQAAYEGSFGEPPRESPSPRAGQKVWVITASVQYADLGEPGQLVDTAERMGWETTLFDGQFNPDVMISGLRQAIADKADGIILVFIDCGLVKAGLEDVADAGIPVVGVESVDCDQSVEADGSVAETGEPRMFDAIVNYENPANPDQPLSYLDFVSKVAAPYQALGIIAATDGAAKIIKLKQLDFPTVAAVDRSFEATLDEYCPDCEVVETVELVGADLGPALQDKVAQAISSHPEANAVQAIYDAAALSVAPAVMASGRSDDLYVMGGEGTAPLVDLIGEGRGVNAGVGYPLRWEAFAGLDAMNRLLAGETPDDIGFPSGMGGQLFDAEHNLPDNGERFEGPVDFETAYFKAWGLE